LEYLLLAAQVILALGLINVWYYRNKKSTAYRGGDAQSLKEEFEAYGLPEPVYYIVGFLKLGSAALFIAGLWFPDILILPSAILVILMLGALAMHIKVKDPIKRSLPAFIMLLLSSFVFYNALCLM